MQVRYCLIRRGLALDQANIMCFKLHDRLAEKLMNARMEEPPSGCLKLSLKQIETADKKFWTLMAEKTRDGIKSGPAGRPCDENFDACLDSPEFLNLLQHRFCSSCFISGTFQAETFGRACHQEAQNGPAKLERCFKGKFHESPE